MKSPKSPASRPKTVMSPEILTCILNYIALVSSVLFVSSHRDLIKERDTEKTREFEGPTFSKVSLNRFLQKWQLAQIYRLFRFLNTLRLSDEKNTL